MRHLVLSVTLLLLANSPASAAGEKLTISAGPSTAEWANKVLKQPLLQDTGIEIVILEDADKKGAGEVLKDIDDKKADVGLAPIPWSAWSKTLIDKKVTTAAHLETLKQRVIGKDALKVIANPNNGITRKLTLAELKQIFAGQIKSWKEVGGADVPIEIYIVKFLEGSNAFFKTRVMGNDPFSPKANSVDTLAALTQDLKQKPGGIGFVSKLTPTEGAAVLDTTEEIGRPITAITAGKPSATVEKAFNYLSKKQLD